jgi:hypothetical protein
MTDDDKSREEMIAILHTEVARLQVRAEAATVEAEAKEAAARAEAAKVKAAWKEAWKARVTWKEAWKAWKEAEEGAEGDGAGAAEDQ